jgi:hypothetical protein
MEDTENYEHILEMFNMIFKKLNPRKKILDIILTPQGQSKKIVLHQFGFLILEDGNQRPTRPSNVELFNFLRFNEPEVFEKVADEINYKHMRVTFREFCKTVNKFLVENKIDNFINENEGDGLEIKISCFKKELFTLENDKKRKITHIIIRDDLDVEIMPSKSSDSSIDLKDILSLENLVMVEQLQKELMDGVKKLNAKLKEIVEKNRPQTLKNMLDKKFAEFVVAEKL